MYEVLSRISSFLSQPFITLTYSIEGMPLLAAFILGLVGALAPCQITGNLGAMALYGNRSIQRGIAWKELTFFILGKIVVFSGLGLIVWMIGQEFQQALTAFFPIARKLIGPLLVLIGLFLAGVIKLKGTFTLGKLPSKLIKNSPTGAFFMGASFSLAFCPTMFVLFFVSLMPLVLASSFGAVLPSIFAIGTSVPLLVLILLIWYFGAGGSMMKKSRKFGSIVQKTAGWGMIIIGILDTIAYWTI